MEDRSDSYCQCLYYAANALARNVTRMADEAYSPTGLSPSLAFLMMTINGKPGIQPSELSQIMQLKPSTVTRLVEKLEYKGLLKRRAEGKYTKIFPTDAGKAMDSTIKECWMNLYHKYTEVIGEEAAVQLTQNAYQASRKLSG